MYSSNCLHSNSSMDADIVYILSGLYIYDFLTIAINAVKLNVYSHLIDNWCVLSETILNYE